jgi:hypothetical protein
VPKRHESDVATKECIREGAAEWLTGFTAVLARERTEVPNRGLDAAILHLGQR